MRDLVPSLITGQGQNFRLGSHMAMAHGDHTQGMACDGLFLLGDHEIARTNGSMSVIGSITDQTRCVGKLDPVIELSPRECLHHHQNATSHATCQQ